VRVCNDFADEIEMAARWARVTFERDSQSSIGIFVPDLAKHRSLIERIFDEICYPSGRRFESVFHLHAAPALREQPIIAGALLLLRAALKRIPVSEAGAILRSAWIEGAAQERNQRALADFELRRSRELDVNLRDLEWASRRCPQFQNILFRLRQVIHDKPATTEFAFWSECFGEILAAFGWPGDRDLSAEEQELVENWKNKLSVLGSLALVSNRVNYAEALAGLKSLLHEPYSIAGDFFSPIQILDAYDAAALRFDHALIVGLSEESSFFAGSTSPLIPLALQRAGEVPGASARSMYANRQQILIDLFSTAPQIWASYSGRVLPVARKFLSEANEEFITWPGRTVMECFAAGEMEAIADTNAPAYRPGGRSLGGTGLIKDQSQCPFRAFAIRRLNARSPEDAGFGLDSRDRGAFAHDALRIIWEQLKTQDALRKIKPLELQFLVHDAVKSAVTVRERGPLHQQLSLAEMNRLAEVILAWLEIERERKKPFRVEVTEQVRALEIAGLRLDIRIDRIDRLNNGKCLLIDYKSGDASAASLDGKRPKEPQLLAYAAAIRDEVDGVFFAQLKPRDPQLIGYGRELHIHGQKPPGKDLIWDEYLQERIAVVERLAASFVGGEAAVDPLPGACDYCDVKPLCRISEVRRSSNGDQVDD
jgi:probable DNA repair protein